MGKVSTGGDFIGISLDFNGYFMEIDIFMDYMIISLGINGIIIYKFGFYGNFTGIQLDFMGKYESIRLIPRDLMDNHPKSWDFIGI